MNHFLRKVFKLLGKEKKRLPIIFILFFTSSLLDVIGIGLIGPYIATLVDPKLTSGFFGNINAWLNISISTNEFIVFGSIILLIIFIFKTISTIWINWVIINFSVKQQYRLSSELMWSYLNAPFEQYLMKNSSEYIHSVQILTQQYANAVIQSLLRIASDGIVIIVIVIMLAWTDIIVLSFLFVVLGAVVFSYDVFFRKKVTLLGKKSNKAQTKMVQGINEGINGLKEIRILGREKYFYLKVKNNAKSYGYYRALSQIISSSPRPVSLRGRCRRETMAARDRRRR